MDGVVARDSIAVELSAPRSAILLSGDSKKMETSRPPEQPGQHDLLLTNKDVSGGTYYSAYALVGRSDVWYTPQKMTL